MVRGGRRSWAWACAIVGLTGCYRGMDANGGADGADDDDGSASADDDDGSGSADDGDDTGVPGCEGVQAASAPLRRLNDRQYRNTVVDLFGGAIEPSAHFPETASDQGYTNDPDANTVSLMNAEDILLAAEGAAAQAVDQLDAILPCDPAPDEGACAAAFVDDFAARAFRRPLRDEERDALIALYDSHRAEAEFGDAIGAVIIAVLQMPQFLYLVEEGEPMEGGVVALRDHEIASRLSYLVWDTMPDPELRAAADAGELRTPDQIETHVRRLIADRERSAPALVRFYREWMQLHELLAVDKDMEAFPQFDDTLASSMNEEADRFVERVLFGDAPTLAELLTTPTTEVDPAMAAFFGIDAPAEGWAEADLPADRRAGLLTRPALLAEHATRHTSSATFRGELVRTQLMCEIIPPPPPGAMAMAPEFPPDSTARERTEILLQEAACSGCHTLMNPIGLGFEHYDAIGAWRDLDVDGGPVDASGIVHGGAPPLAGEFDGLVQLGQMLAGSEIVRDCVAEQFTRHALGADENQLDECTVDGLALRFAESDGDLVELVVAFTTAESFRMRRVEEG
jgi:hypothetical protein